MTDAVAATFRRFDPSEISCSRSLTIISTIPEEKMSLAAIDALAFALPLCSELCEKKAISRKSRSVMMISVMTSADPVFVPETG